MLHNFKSKQFVHFLLAGGLSALVNFGSRFVYNDFMSFGNAVIFAYLTGMVMAFILFKFFVFDSSKNPIKKEIFYFILVNMVAIVQTYFISITLVENVFPHFDFVFYPQVMAHITGIVVPVFTSFFGHKFLSFKDNDV